MSSRDTIENTPAPNRSAARLVPDASPEATICRWPANSYCRWALLPSPLTEHQLPATHETPRDQEWHDLAGNKGWDTDGPVRHNTLNILFCQHKHTSYHSFFWRFAYYIIIISNNTCTAVFFYRSPSPSWFGQLKPRCSRSSSDHHNPTEAA